MSARNQTNLRKEDFIYAGIDRHKETHTAVILDCWNTKLSEITFANTPAKFPKLVRKVKKYCTENKQAVYGNFHKYPFYEAEIRQELFNHSGA